MKLLVGLCVVAAILVAGFQGVSTEGKYAADMHSKGAPPSFHAHAHAYYTVHALH